jgi:hypothetical protein
MPPAEKANPAATVNDAFDKVTDEQFYVWIAELNTAAKTMGSTNDLLEINNLAKGISYWYITLKIARKWNDLDVNNNHWAITKNNVEYGDETISVKDIFDEFEKSHSRGKYQLSTIRRYVGELRRTKLVDRVGDAETGRLKPSMQLLRALGNTQKSWKRNYDVMSGTMDKLLVPRGPRHSS